MSLNVSNPSSLVVVGISAGLTLGGFDAAADSGRVPVKVPHVVWGPESFPVASCSLDGRIFCAVLSPVISVP